MSKTKDQNTITRREALRRAIVGAAGIAMADCDLWAQTTASLESKALPTGRAKAVIQLWMGGGPCHLDTFDPKPGAGNDYCGPFTKPIATKVPGIQICELLPMLAQRADKYSIIRTMTHGEPGHETAAYLVQTGHNPKERLVYPGAGAVVSLFKGYDHGYKSQIPPYIVVTESLGRFSEAGFLGPRYKPFATGGDPNQKLFAVEGIVSRGISETRQHSRRELLHSLDSLALAMPGNPQLTAYDDCVKQADQIVAETGKVFDLSEEKDAIKDQYGRNKFGQSCLVARRLIERGVPYVTVNFNGWDTHKQHFETMRRKLPELDRGMATLLQDLSERGLLDSTIVWWSGEFGRTPKIAWEAPWNGGRGHFGACFCAVLAGGGFKGGRVVGESDSKGMEVKDRPVHSEDVLGSIYTQLGIDPESPMAKTRGEEIKVMSASPAGAGGGMLREIM